MAADFELSIGAGMEELLADHTAAEFMDDYGGDGGECLSLTREDRRGASRMSDELQRQ